MGEITEASAYIPDVGESALVWPEAFNETWALHGTFDYHVDPAKPWPDIWVHPDPTYGDDSLSGSRPDMAKNHVQAAVDALPNGGDIRVISSGRRARATDQPHIDLGSTPISIVGQQHVRLFLGTSDVDGQGGTTGGHSMCWIRGAVANGALINVRSAARFEMWGGTLENTASGGIGLATRQAIAYTLRKVEAINCAGAGFRHRTSGSDSSEMDKCTATGCGIGLLIESTTSTDSEFGLNNRAAPNNLRVVQGQYELCTQNCIACIADSGAGGLRGLQFVQVKLQHPAAKDWDGSYADRALFLGRGISSAELLGCYNEASDDSVPHIDAPMVRLRECRGGTASNEADWNGPIRMVGGEWTYAPSLGSWSQYVGAHVHAESTRGLYLAGVKHFGGLTDSLLTVNHPLISLLGNTKDCEAHARWIGNYSVGGRPTTAVQVVHNAGTGNFGTWWDPGANAPKLWGTQPS